MKNSSIKGRKTSQQVSISANDLKTQITTLSEQNINLTKQITKLKKT
jgi:hypothetical protein